MLSAECTCSRTAKLDKEGRLCLIWYLWSAMPLNTMGVSSASLDIPVYISLRQDSFFQKRYGNRAVDLEKEDHLLVHEPEGDGLVANESLIMALGIRNHPCNKEQEAIGSMSQILPQIGPSSRRRFVKLKTMWLIPQSSSCGRARGQTKSRGPGPQHKKNLQA